MEFNSIEVGTTAEFTRIITKQDVLDFANITGDKNPLHIDEEYASQTQFKETIPHGMLIGSLFSTLVGMHLPGRKCLYLSQNLTFPRPTPFNKKLIVSGKVVNKIEALNILVIETIVSDDEGNEFVKGEAKVQVL